MNASQNNLVISSLELTKPFGSSQFEITIYEMDEGDDLGFCMELDKLVLPITTASSDLQESLISSRCESGEAGRPRSMCLYLEVHYIVLANSWHFSRLTY